MKQLIHALLLVYTLYYCFPRFTAALLLLYYCQDPRYRNRELAIMKQIRHALLLLYYCFTTALLLPGPAVSEQRASDNEAAQTPQHRAALALLPRSLACKPGVLSALALLVHKYKY
jgi:hypothetical protein